MRKWMAWVLAAVGVQAGAMELFEDGKFSAQAVSAYAMQPGDTLAGYAIFRPEPARLARTEIGSTTGGDHSLRMPYIVQVYEAPGRWFAVQTTTVTVGMNSTTGWGGDPCGGETIIKINRIRGRFDRCAIARLTPLALAGGDQTVLELKFTETNSGGRFYELVFLVNLVGNGITLDALTDEKGAVHAALKDWMGRMLDAVIVAAGYNKPGNAFDGVPPPWKVLAQ